MMIDPNKKKKGISFKTIVSKLAKKKDKKPEKQKRQSIKV